MSRRCGQCFSPWKIPSMYHYNVSIVFSRMNYNTTVGLREVIIRKLVIDATFRNFLKNILDPVPYTLSCKSLFALVGMDCCSVCHLRCLSRSSGCPHQTIFGPTTAGLIKHKKRFYTFPVQDKNGCSLVRSHAAKAEAEAGARAQAGKGAGT